MNKSAKKFIKLHKSIDNLNDKIRELKREIYPHEEILNDIAMEQLDLMYQLIRDYSLGSSYEYNPNEYHSFVLFMGEDDDIWINVRDYDDCSLAYVKLNHHMLNGNSDLFKEEFSLELKSLRESNVQDELNEAISRAKFYQDKIELLRSKQQ